MENMNTDVRVERFKTHLHPQGLQRNQVQSHAIHLSSNEFKIHISRKCGEITSTNQSK